MVEAVPLSPRELIRHLPDLLAGEEPGLDNPRVTDFLVEHPTARIAVTAASCLSHALRDGMSSRGLDRPTRLTMEALAAPLRREMALLSFRAGVAELEVYAKKNDIAYRGFAEKVASENPYYPLSPAECEALGELVDSIALSPLLAWAENPPSQGSLVTSMTLLAHARLQIRTPALDWFLTQVRATLAPADAVRMWEPLAKTSEPGADRARALGEFALVLDVRGHSELALDAHMAATIENPRDDAAWFNAMLAQALSGRVQSAVRSGQELMINMPPSQGVVAQYVAQLRSNADDLRDSLQRSPAMNANLPDALDGALRSTLLEITR